MTVSKQLVFSPQKNTTVKMKVSSQPSHLFSVAQVLLKPSHLYTQPLTDTPPHSQEFNFVDNRPFPFVRWDVSVEFYRSSVSPPCRAHNPYNSTNQVGMAGRMITTQISQSVPYYVPSTHTTPILSSCFTVHYPTYLLSPSFHPASRPSHHPFLPFISPTVASKPLLASCF